MYAILLLTVCMLLNLKVSHGATKEEKRLFKDLFKTSEYDPAARPVQLSRKRVFFIKMQYVDLFI